MANQAAGEDSQPSEQSYLEGTVEGSSDDGGGESCSGFDDRVAGDGEGNGDSQEGCSSPSSTPDSGAAGEERECSPPVPLVTTRSFAELRISRAVLDALEHAGYRHPTPIQEAIIPLALRGRDVIGQSQTGTGKTAAYLLPFLTRWRPHRFRGPIGLVMVPTRELALQVSAEAHKLAPCRRFRVVTLYGGVPLERQTRLLKHSTDLVVGTPGRLLDHLRRGTLQLRDVRYVVLDEADRMLDIGFRPDIERILRHCPSQRQTLLMSATVPEAVLRLVHRYMTDPQHVNLMPEQSTVATIRQSYITVDAEKKFELLCYLLERESPRQCLIFVARKQGADELYRQLKPRFAETAVIHGDLTQRQRERIMAAFRSGDIRFLIATDVMSRGIDVEGISHVINYDLPEDADNYIHRIGRTGRLGRDGVAISFVTPEQGELLTRIEMTINRLLDKEEVEGEWFTPRLVISAEPFLPNPLDQLPRDEEGWWKEEEEPPFPMPSSEWSSPPGDRSAVSSARRLPRRYRNRL
ncbi:MAG: DEAD/DEAH box helicase [Thermogemmata sp.]